MMGDDHKSNRCPHAGCGVLRERHIDRATGRYAVIYAAACPHKAQCEREMMAGWDYVSEKFGPTVGQAPHMVSK